MLPALRDIGAVGFFAYSVQPKTAHQRFKFAVVLTLLPFNGKPGRLAVDSNRLDANRTSRSAGSLVGLEF